MFKECYLWRRSYLKEAVFQSNTVALHACILIIKITLCPKSTWLVILLLFQCLSVS